MNNFWKFAEREKKNNFYIYKRLVRERREMLNCGFFVGFAWTEGNFCKFISKKRVEWKQMVIIDV